MGVSVGDAGLVSSMGVDPLDGGSGVILGIISSKMLESVSIGDGGSAVNSGTTSSNWTGGSCTGGAVGMVGMTGGATGGMTSGIIGGAAGGAVGGAGGTAVVDAGGAEVVGGGGDGWG